MKIVKPLLKAVTIAGAMTFLIGGAVYSQVSGTKVDVSQLKINPSPTEIYDRNGDPFAKFHRQKRYETKPKDIPKEVIESLVATEDRDFYKHSGISVAGIFRALVADIKAGAFVQGGSTITQQLMKTVYFKSDKEIKRKIDEAVFATAVEQQFSKDEIIAMYLNHIFFSQNAYGIEDAIMTYYGQSLKEFKADDRVNRIAKSALMTGLPQAPSAFDPYVNPKAALQKRNIVITKMWEEDYITKDEYEKAIKKPLMILPKPNTSNDEVLKYDEIVSFTLLEAQKQLKVDSVQQVINSGLKIHTSFDPELYQSLRKNFDKNDMFPYDAGDGTKAEGAASFIDPKSGEVVAFTGARDGKVPFLGYNRAYQMTRQPGSSMKPVLDYAPLMEYKGFHPWSLLAADVGHSFGDYSTRDHCTGSSWRTMKDSLRMSCNTPAIWALDQVGIDNAKKFVDTLGIKLTEDDKYLPIALGGISQGVSPMTMADSYQAFANGGTRTPAHIIRRIVSSNGDIEFETPIVNTRVMKKENADYMRYMLRSVVTSGTGTEAGVEGQMIAGKTGTTELPGSTSKVKDAWFVGFTKDYVGAVWMGFDNTNEVRSLWQSSEVPSKMFRKVLEPMLQKNPDPVSNYQDPSPVKPKISKFSMEAKVSKTGKSVKLSWDKPEGDGQSKLSYRIMRNGEEIKKTKDTSFTDNGVESGKSYMYEIQGVNEYDGFLKFVSDTVTVEIPKQEKSDKDNKKDEEKKDDSKKEDEKKNEEVKTEEPKKDDTKTEEKENDSKPTEEDKETKTDENKQN